MPLAEVLPSAFILAIAAVITACGGIFATIMSARRAREEERAACEEKLRAVRLEAGALAEELYELKAHREARG